MKKMAITTLALALVACSDNSHVPHADAPRDKPEQAAPPVTQQPTQQAQAPAPAPVVVQQPQQHDNTAMNMLAGGVLGYMMGSAGRSQAPAPAPAVREVVRVEKHYYQSPKPEAKTPPPTAQAAPQAPIAPKVVPTPTPAAATPPAPAPKPTPAPSYAVRPSYSSQSAPRVTYSSPKK